MKLLPKRKSTRLKEYDYSQFGFYFITICLSERKAFFSKVIDGKNILTEFGKIVEDILIDLPKYYNIEIDSYIIMPDHIHIIIVVDNDPNREKNIPTKIKTLSDVIGKLKSTLQGELGLNLKALKILIGKNHFMTESYAMKKNCIR
ncbi:MAG: transposase [Ignavibacteriaceae bacterium]|nr:transposase [Ignavibacteriaceae bacterium]